MPTLTLLSFVNTKVRNCLVVMYHNVRRTAALKKFSAIIPLGTVGALIHGAGRSKEQKSEEDQAALKVLSHVIVNLNFKGAMSKMVCLEKIGQFNVFKFVVSNPS